MTYSKTPVGQEMKVREVSLFIDRKGHLVRYPRWTGRDTWRSGSCVQLGGVFI